MIVHSPSTGRSPAPRRFAARHVRGGLRRPTPALAFACALGFAAAAVFAVPLGVAAQTAQTPARPQTPAVPPPAPRPTVGPVDQPATAPAPAPAAPRAPAPAGQTPAGQAPPKTAAPAGAKPIGNAPPPEGKAATVAATPQTLSAAIDRLGTLEFPIRMQASRTVRRAPAPQAVPALVQAATKHKDGYVRFRALVLLAGFPDPQVKQVMVGVLNDPNDRLRDVAYAYLERNPDPAVAPQLLAKLDKETSEFVRPSLMRALATLGNDPTVGPKVQQALLREVNRGQDFFRSIVIDALGTHKATYAIAALSAIAKQDGPLQDDAVLALGRIGDKRVLETIAAQQRTAPRERQPALAAAICLLGVNCGSHELFLSKTLDFTVMNPGFQALTRSAANGLGAVAQSGRDTAWDILIEKGQNSVDPHRSPLALGLATAAVANPDGVLAALGRTPDPKAALLLLRDGFDMLEEDFSEEQFYVNVRRAYWKMPEGGPARKVAESVITTLEF